MAPIGVDGNRKKRLLRRCDTAPKNKITSVELSENGSERKEEKKL
jgi:hypothetical protein